MSQNVLGPSDCKIFKSTISLKQNDEKVWFFACWYNFVEIKSWLKNIGIGMVINVCAHSGCRNLKLNELVIGVLILIQESLKLL